MMDKAQGQVWWANLPDPLGWRPVLILTRDDALPKLHYATVAPLTRTIRGLDSEVVLEPDDGVPSRSAVTLDNIATIDQDLLDIIPGDKTNKSLRLPDHGGRFIRYVPWDPPISGQTGGESVTESVTQGDAGGESRNCRSALRPGWLYHQLSANLPDPCF